MWIPGRRPHTKLHVCGSRGARHGGLTQKKKLVKTFWNIRVGHGYNYVLPTLRIHVPSQLDSPITLSKSVWTHRSIYIYIHIHIIYVYIYIFDYIRTSSKIYCNILPPNNHTFGLLHLQSAHPTLSLVTSAHRQQAAEGPAPGPHS